MTDNYFDIIDNIKLADKDSLTSLISVFSPEIAEYARTKARKLTDEIFGRNVYLRGLIEISNICKNNCFYCGIRRSNKCINRYRLSKEQILECCKKGYEYGFRTFVLQGGEDSYYFNKTSNNADFNLIEDIVCSIRKFYPDCAITLSLGELPTEQYDRLRSFGADRYLLRHETINPVHYGKLHPSEMSYDNRIRCLYDLKKSGYQTGCGIMVGSPFQTADNIADDLIFIRDFKPEMVGIGPFIPQKDTPFGNEKAGSVELTLFLLSLIRLMLPDVLLPSTTALGVLGKNGRIAGLDAGANVIMPNLTPEDERKNYILYDNKAIVNDNALTQLNTIKSELIDSGYIPMQGRGDYKKYEKEN